MKISVNELAELTGAEVHGDSGTFVFQVARIQEAKSGELAMVYLESYAKHIAGSEASVILTAPQWYSEKPGTVFLLHPQPRKAFQKILDTYFQKSLKLDGIDASAFIDPTAKLGVAVAVGRNVVIGKNVVVGDGSKIYHNTVIDDEVTIGINCSVYQNVSIRENSVIGNRVVIQAGAVIGADGFGFEPDEEGKYSKIAQVGNVVLEDDVEIGANTTVDRAALGSTLVKRGAKLDNLVMIAHNVEIGEHTAIAAQAGISGSTKVGRRCMIGGQVGMVGHIKIGDDVMIGAQAGINSDIMKPGLYSGTPARLTKELYRNYVKLSHIDDYIARISKLEQKLKELEEKLAVVEPNKS